MDMIMRERLKLTGCILLGLLAVVAWVAIGFATLVNGTIAEMVHLPGGHWPLIVWVALNVVALAFGVTYMPNGHYTPPYTPLPLPPPPPEPPQRPFPKPAGPSDYQANRRVEEIARSR